MARWTAIERDLRTQYGPLLVGVDEVGRGPLAGPVVACAVVMPAEQRAISGVNDSKQLDAETRERLAVRIRSTALAIGIGAASSREVDRLNIYHATVRAMQRALARVNIIVNARTGSTPHHVLVDGLPLRTLGVKHTAVVKGDAKCYAIACASIIAKVTRDRLMHQLDVRYGGYGWSTNVGYGTREHRSAISVQGLTPHHRTSFCTRMQYEFDLAGDTTDDSLENSTLLGADFLDVDRPTFDQPNL